MRLRLSHCLAALVLSSAPALADDYVAFHSPSGNIHCAIMTGSYSEARCDIFDYTPSFRKRPADCDLEWGPAFAVDAQGKGYVACVGDTVADPNGFVLDYGKSFSLGAYTCTSEKSGMTCTNGLGHGFKVAKAKQSVF
ncbi:DUF6636 domain-containing protein [Xinfangfangia pollutisoli]|uniref:DUF6636 domain-containing protein n=1 Tax=Xinfangfangia pollutisoli TaxID=2865960 RepID=UPI001CD408FB|nr:DUF6636 domain-containing protein [Xinfangfangia pollutisoli]